MFAGDVAEPQKRFGYRPEAAFLSVWVDIDKEQVRMPIVASDVAEEAEFDRHRNFRKLQSLGRLVYRTGYLRR